MTIMRHQNDEYEDSFESELSPFAPSTAAPKGPSGSTWARWEEEGPFATEEPLDESRVGLDGEWEEAELEDFESWEEAEDELETDPESEFEAEDHELEFDDFSDSEQDEEGVLEEWDQRNPDTESGMRAEGEWEEFELGEAFAPEPLADEQSLSEELEEDQVGAGRVSYPSGESLPIVSGPDGSDADEYWDPNRANVPLVDTSATQVRKRLSRSFIVEELARSGSHRFEKARIDPNLIRCLQAIRDRVGRPVRVNSGYRSWGYNRQLYRGRNQKPTLSRHCSGQAADIVIDGMSGLEVARTAIDAYGDKIGVGVDKRYAHVDVRGTWARWTYPGLGGAEARARVVAELDAYRRGRMKTQAAPDSTPATHVIPPAPSSPSLLTGIPSLGGNPVPSGFRRDKKGRGLLRYGGGRLDEALLRLRHRGAISVTDDEIDTFQRIANVESSKLLNGINTWDDAVVSLGFMQLTLKWGELQKWIARAPAAFARHGIALDEGRKYSWGPKNPQSAIRGASDKNELRWNGWAERFYRAGEDEDAIVAEVGLAREILRRHLTRLEGFVKKIPSGFDRWMQHYRASAHLRGMFHEGFNNRPKYALGAAASALRSAAVGTVTGRFLEIYRDALIAAYGREAQKARNVVAKTAEGARLSAASGALPAQPPPATPLSLARVSPPAGGSSEIAPFAVPSRFGYRTSGGRRQRPVYGIVVHTTGSGPATNAGKNATAGRGCQTAIDCALQYYRNGGGGFPHYVIDFDGTLHATCPESHIAWHAGWTAKAGGRGRWKNFAPPSWWARVWGATKTPLDLIPPGAASPNSQHLGIEILGSARSGPYTDPQYSALARLVADIDRRHGLGLDRAPSTRLLGHEDVNPLTSEGGRANAKGGWDPGAHRVEGVSPRFSWSRLWSLITEARAQREAEEEVFADGAEMTGEYDRESLSTVTR